MERPRSSSAGSDREPDHPARWPWVVGAGVLLGIMLAVLAPGRRTGPVATITRNSRDSTKAAEQSAAAHDARLRRAHLPPGASEPVLSPEEIVADKVARFVQSRRKIAHAMAKRFKVNVAPDVEQFFEAVEGGRWEELNADFKALLQRHQSGNADDLRVLWGPILESLLIAECAHNWPAQRLLDYGQATLGSLRPGMVYVGGTDAGRGIPTFLNETGDGEQHIIITQNGLADSSYLQYLDFLYGDRVASLTSEDSDRAFQDYLSDAQKRLAHDQQFPDEPKQMRPGENVQMIDGHIQASGDVAVMGVNENLLKAFMAKNPDLSFALEESFALKSTYPNAVPLGPLMELGVKDVQSSFTGEAADRTVNYWRDSAQQFASDPASPDDSLARLTYAKMAASQAALLADHQYGSQAEQAYRLAMQISPDSPEAVYGLGQLLDSTGRTDEGRQLIADFERAHPPKTLPPPPKPAAFWSASGLTPGH